MIETSNNLRPHNLWELKKNLFGGVKAIFKFWCILFVFILFLTRHVCRFSVLGYKSKYNIAMNFDFSLTLHNWINQESIFEYLVISVYYSFINTGFQMMIFKAHSSYSVGRWSIVIILLIFMISIHIFVVLITTYFSPSWVLSKVFNQKDFGFTQTKSCQYNFVICSQQPIVPAYF